MTLFSMEAPLLPAVKLDEVCTGCRALPRRPRAVELGCILRGSETDRRDGNLFGYSSGLSGPGPSRGVLASEDSSEPGDPGVAQSLASDDISSGVAGNGSGPVIGRLVGIEFRGVMTEGR